MRLDCLARVVWLAAVFRVFQLFLAGRVLFLAGRVRLPVTAWQGRLVWRGRRKDRRLRL